MDAQPTPIKPEYLLPGTMVGPWEIVDLLGKGGFGVAYKVRRDGRYYALKLTLCRAADLEPEQRERHETRVRRECGILLQLSHPNIVRVHGFERWPDLNEGYLYIVMDLVEGQELYSWRAQSVPSLRRICYVFQRISLALAEAHARGAFHRDVKSENVLVTASGEPVLIDWGIARSRGAVTVTQDHTVVGTHSHFPPEYCRYIDFDSGSEEFVWTAPSELHSIGYMLYEVLTGRSPFNLTEEESTSDQNIILQRLQRATHAIKNISPSLPSLINAKVPGSLDRVAMKLLEKNPADRFATGLELSKALEDALADADPSWDGPFDVPPPPSRSAPMRGASLRPPQAGSSQPEMLPPLADAAAKSSHQSEDSVLEIPAADEMPAPFRPPTGEEHRAERSAPASHSAEDAVAAAKAALADRIPASRSPLPRIVALAAAAALIGGAVLIRASQSAPRHPESLLRKVESAAASQVSTPATRKAPLDETASSGLPPMGPAASPSKSQLSRTDERPLTTAAPRPLAPPPAAPRFSAVRDDRMGRRPEREAHDDSKNLSKHEEDSSLEFGQRFGGDAAAQPKGAVRYHVQTGARIRARLDINLDSRTVGAGPAVVKLVRAYISEGRVIFPAGTMAYGEARATSGRFTVRFTRLVLPDKTEVAFDGLAYDLQDRKPGLAPARLFAGTQQREGTGAKVGRAIAGTVLTTVSGGLAQDAARTAAETALNNRESDSGGSAAETLLLDAGADMDVLVTKPF